MKKPHFNLLLAFLFFLPLGVLKAQDIKNQAFYVHEDRVKPSMIGEYNKISKEFAETCKKHKLADVSWTVSATNTGRYFNVSPIENFAEMDKNAFAPLMEKMGDEAFKDIFKRFDACYDQHGDYIVLLNNELTYMPEDANSIIEEENFRKWHFLYVTPENIQNLKGKLKELKALFEKKGSKEYYRIFHNGFGSMGDYYVAVLSAKDAEDYAKKSKENDVLLGDEGDKLFGDMMKYVVKYEVETGEMLPDAAYSPAPIE